jgi:hypothetical protein
MKVLCWGCASGRNHSWDRRNRKKDPYLCPRKIKQFVSATGPNAGYLIYDCECICVKPKKVPNET